jgi:hypothetical protein
MLDAAHTGQGASAIVVAAGRIVRLDRKRESIMTNQPRNTPSAARLERELARERQQHVNNRESKAGINLDEAERIKDARQNFESTRVRR